MHELSLRDIDQISRDVRAQEITFSHLADDLTDHICCDVEYVMQSGIPFAEAYKLVRQKMGSGRRLKEIQEETLYAVDTKYRKMKNTMKVSGIVGTILFGFASLFKIMHWPLAGVFMTLGALILAFMFMPSALGVLWKESHSQKRLFLFISAFLAAMFFILGILFKVQHWPGAGIIITLAGLTAVLFLVPSFLYTTLANTEHRAPRAVYITGAIAIMVCMTGFFFKIMHWPLAGFLITIGMLVLCGIAFPWYVITAYKNEPFVRAEFIYLIVGSIIILVPVALTVINVQGRFDEGYYTNIASGSAQYNYLAGTNGNFIREKGDSASSIQMQELHAVTGEVIAVINRVETKMIALTKGEPGAALASAPSAVQPEVGKPVALRNLRDPFSPVPFNDLLTPGSSQRKEIEKALADYREYISEAFPAEAALAANRLFDASAYLPGTGDEKSVVSFLTALHSLSMMKNSVLTAENTLLRTLADSN